MVLKFQNEKLWLAGKQYNQHIPFKCAKYGPPHNCPFRIVFKAYPIDSSNFLRVATNHHPKCPNKHPENWSGDNFILKENTGQASGQIIRQSSTQQLNQIQRHLNQIQLTLNQLQETQLNQQQQLNILRTQQEIINERLKYTNMNNINK